MIFAIVIIVILVLLYLFAVKGRLGNKDIEKLRGFNYAHRGLHGGGLPENSMSAFAAAFDKGYGIEFDLHLLKDGTLAVMHDSALMRTTKSDGIIEDLTKEDLKNYQLEGTAETIPTFEQVLSLCDGNAPLIIELKPVNNNHDALAKAAYETLKNYNGAYCIESFDPRVVLWFKKNAPDIARGQLAENFLKSKTQLPFILKFVATHILLNFITKPDFIAYKFNDRKSTPTIFLCQKLWKMQLVGWTLKNEQEQLIAKKENWISIFEFFLP